MIYAVPNPLRSTALARPDHPVLLYEGQTLTGRQLLAAVRQRGAWLQNEGIQPGDVVGLIAPPSIDWIIAFHAIGWLGAVTAPLPEAQPDHELQRLLDQLRPDVLLSTDDTPPSIASAARRLPIAPSAAERGETATPPEERFWPLDEPRTIIFTSGTTGHPRRVELTTAQLLFSGMGSTIRLGHDVHDRWLACLPLHHIGGLSILTRCALLGTCVELQPQFDAEIVAHRLDSGAITLVSLVPTMLDRVLDARPHVPFPGSLRAILVGGAPMSTPLLERCRAIGAPLALTWGMSETASQIATRFAGDLGNSAGAPPLAFARVDTTEEGRLVVSGPVARAGHITTDDLGEVDAAGRVHISGRADDVILSGGEKVVPAEIELLLAGHPAVAEVAVVAHPDDRWGQRPTAFVVVRDSGVDSAQLSEWCRERLAAFKVPDRFIWRASLPRNDNGKIARDRLLHLAADHQKRAQQEQQPPAMSAPTATEQLLHRLGESCQSDRVKELGAQLRALREWLVGDLAAVEQQIAELSASQRDIAHAAAAHLLLQPGKRIRPLCVLIAGRLGGVSPRGELARRLEALALACELVHAATLLHDDVVDLGTERRGAPAARALYGNTASILAGDHLLTEALRQVTARGTPELLDGLLSVIGEMIGAEALQLEQQHRFDPRPDLYLRIVEGKTAALFRWGLLAGTTLAELPAEVRGAAGEFGRSLGIAFQLVDDLLDLDGDPTRVGKDALADLREGKLTWPLLVAAQRDPALAADLRESTSNTSVGTGNGEALVARIRATGAIAATRGAAAEYAERAAEALGGLPAGQARRALRTVVDFCIARVS